MKNSEVYEKVTNTILTALEAGVVPWKCPWHKSDFPKSMSTGKMYQGCNLWVLSLIQMAHNYKSSYWGTYKQIAELGGQVRKGEKASSVYYVSSFIPKEEKQRAEKEGSTPQRIWLYRSYSVFNADQADDIPEKFKSPELKDHIMQVETAESILDNWKLCPEIRHQGQSAHYAPKTDEIYMPEKGNFSLNEDPDKDTASYYATLFHEVGHSTGHPSRLGRMNLEKLDAFGSKGYAKEELVAEMFSNMILAFADIQHEPEVSAAYIQHWRDKISQDNRLVIQAASQASKAVEFVLKDSPHLLETEEQQEKKELCHA